MRRVLVSVIAITGVFWLSVHHLLGGPETPEAELTVQVQLQAVKRGAQTVIQGTVGKTTFQAPYLVINAGRPNESVFSPVDGQLQLKHSKGMVRAGVMRFKLRDGKVTGTSFSGDDSGVRRLE